MSTFVEDQPEKIGEYKPSPAGENPIFISPERISHIQLRAEDLRNKPLDVQVGGGHYKNMVIQPVVFSLANNLNVCQHSAIKYICRYKDKGGKEDLEKAKHFIDILIQWEYGDGKEQAIQALAALLDLCEKDDQPRKVES